MPRKDFDRDAYLTELTAGLPEAEAAVIKANLTGNQTVVDRLADSVLRNAEGSRLAAELRKKENETEAFYGQLLELDKQNKAQFAAAQAEAAQYKAQVSKYESEFGKLNGEVTPPIDTSKFLTREEAERIQAGWVDFTAEATRLATAHAREFGEDLDTKALFEQAAKQRKDLKSVYDAQVAERRDASAQKALDERVKAAYEKGLAAGTGSAKLPPTPLFNDMTPSDLRAAQDSADKRPSWKRGMEDWLAGKFEKEASVPG